MCALYRVLCVAAKQQVVFIDGTVLSHYGRLYKYMLTNITGTLEGRAV